MEILETLYRWFMSAYYIGAGIFCLVAIYYGIVAICDPGREWRK